MVNPELLKLLDIDESDLVANRAGQMGEHQKARLSKDVRRQTRAAVAFGVFFAAFTLLLIVQHNGIWPLMLAVGAVFVGLCLMFAGQERRGTSADVYCLTGPYTLHKTNTGNGGQGIGTISLWIDIDGKHCLLPTLYSLDPDRWQAAIGNGSAKVYAINEVKPKTVPLVVGIEPADG